MVRIYSGFCTHFLDKSNHYTPFNLGYFTNYKTRMKNISEYYVNRVILTECVCCGSIYYRLCRGGPTRCLWTGMASPAASPSTRS